MLDAEVHAPGKVKETEVDPSLRQLKPSEAIRIGAALRPQCYGAPFSNGGSCAMGAMWEGYGNPYQAFPELTSSKLGKLSEGLRLLPIDVFAQAHIYNDAGWTREQIADWLEAQGL